MNVTVSHALRKRASEDGQIRNERENAVPHPVLCVGRVAAGTAKTRQARHHASRVDRAVGTRERQNDRWPFYGLPRRGEYGRYKQRGTKMH